MLDLSWSLFLFLFLVKFNPSITTVIAPLFDRWWKKQVEVFSFITSSVLISMFSNINNNYAPLTASAVCNFLHLSAKRENMYIRGAFFLFSLLTVLFEANNFNVKFEESSQPKMTK